VSWHDGGRSDGGRQELAPGEPPLGHPLPPARAIVKYMMIERKNIQKLIKMLREHSDTREIIIDDIKKIPRYSSYIGVCRQTSNEILIYSNYGFPENIQEANIIHELLHVLLDHEGFPRVEINKNKFRNANPEAKKVLSYLRDHFRSTIDHPQVFNREINEFDIDVCSYFDIQVEQKKHRFERRVEGKKDKNYYFLRQQDILIGLDYYSFPSKHRRMIQKIFRSLYPETYKYCNTLYKKLKFNNPNEVYTSAQKIKKDIIRYGRKKGLSKINKLWDAIDIL
jgi:hypothetical protein